jgi:hypothetical protein
MRGTDMDAFNYKEKDGRFLLEANGCALLQTHDKTTAEATILNARDEEAVQRMHDRARALKAFTRLGRLRPAA